MPRNICNVYVSGVLLLLVLNTIPGFTFAQIDTTHHSTVFKGPKPYRIYLPESYYQSKTARYPVIYYFHGNKGDHKIPFPEVAALVKNSSVILVCWNGRSVPGDDRPYNIGYHSNINYPVQFKDYFPELVHHIDSSYRTMADRAHRGLIGHSMGGFMSWYLAGKYPQMVSVSVNSKGSPEFFAGIPNRHTLYQQRYMFPNFQGVKLRFQNGSLGEELVHLNTEVHTAALREPALDYQYQAYEGPHNLTFAQFKDAFDFTVRSLGNDAAPPARWHHADFSPDFEVWDYKVTSNLTTPGYIVLRGVSKGGLTTLTRKWQPDGGVIPGVNLKVTTAPAYKPLAAYSLLDFNQKKDSISITTVSSNNLGAITFTTDNQPHIFGIFDKNSPADMVMAGFKTGDSSRFIQHNKKTDIRLRLLNRGGQSLENATVTLISHTPGVTITKNDIKIKEIKAGTAGWTETSFQVMAANAPPADGTTPYASFTVQIKDGKGNKWVDEFEALPMYAVPEFKDIGVDDGDSEIYGSGNGNNIAAPGEKIMIYQYSHRTRLYFDDPYIESESLHDDLQPDKWGDGYALSSLVRISPDCPPGHVIRFLACYEVKEWKTIKRNVTWGTFSITVGEK